MEKLQLLHLGCGDLVGPHWLNTDGSLNVLLDNRKVLRLLVKPFLPESSKNIKFRNAMYLDLRGRWPYDTGTFDAIYSSHFFEHLSFADGQHVLQESFRCLKPGGKIRFLIPSVRFEVAQYMKYKADGNPLAATEFARITNVFQTPRPGPWWYRLFFSIYNKNTHKMFYDAESLAHYFQQAGFADAVARTFHQSDIPHLDEVEKADRFQHAECVEAVRPLVATAQTPQKIAV